MSKRPMGAVLQHLRKLVSTHAAEEVSDRQLLKRFAAEQDETAFAALVERHGPMVLGVCRRVLQNATDAEDAFQASFLVLARKAGAMGWQESVGPWLFKVAQRIAIKARSQLHRRQTTEIPQSSLPTRGDEAAELDAQAETPDPAAAVMEQEIARVLDQELSRLPSRYRSPLVLCYLEGKTNEQAARELGWPVGSISRHLTRARDLLRERMVQRGVVCTSVALGGLLAPQKLSAALPQPLAQATVRAGLLFFGRSAAAGLISSNAVTLAEGMLKTMTITNLKMATGVLLVLGAVGLGAGQAVQGDGNAGAAAKQKKTAEAKPAGERGAAGAPAPAPETQLDPEKRVMLLGDKLRKPVILEQGIDRSTLKDALEFIESRYEVPIFIDQVAFNAEGPPGGDKAGLTADVPVNLPKLNGTSLRSVLQMLSDQVSGVLLVKPDGVHVTTRKRAWPSYWSRGSRELVPTVDAAFKDNSLEEALQELAMQTGINVIVDPTAEDVVGKTSVRANLRGVPLDTAVRLLANMSSLYVVAVDNVLYVTTAEKANELLTRFRNENDGIAPDGVGGTVPEVPAASKPAAKKKTEKK